MSQSIIQVDAFTNIPFKGNPAAVCVMATAAADEWMHQVAAEMNLSETAFLVNQPCAEGQTQGADYALRWFTPEVEVDLCGHATLASAHVLWSEGFVAATDAIRFHTKSGQLVATLASAADGNWITLDCPSQPVTPIAAPPALIRALECDVRGVYASDANYLVEVESEATLRSLHPDMALLSQLPLQGAIVTASGSGGCESDPHTSTTDTTSTNTVSYDFVSRYFAPNAGIDEDPVTGSAHCSLVPFWTERLHKSEMLAYQVSARGGMLKVVDRGDRVAISGQAVTVMKGELL
ncbi:MAG: PhzF family phenazine biosynthesis protein [Cyanobacteria bacterium P01_E01_bin.45]